MNISDITKIKVGQVVKFDPFRGIRFYGSVFLGSIVTGTIIDVNNEHQYFTAEYGDEPFRISFKFDDIGNAVKIIG